MQYEILTPTSTDFNVDRAFSIVRNGFAKLGVKVTQKVGGDTTADLRARDGRLLGAGEQAVHGLRHRHVGLGRLHRPGLHAAPS